jgi:hypothetical protein
MSLEIIIDNEYATLSYDPDSGIVQHQFHKFIYGDHFRAVLNTVIDLFNDRDATKWLADDRLISTLTSEDAAWAQFDWTPRVWATGWKYWAVILPDKRVGQVHLNFSMSLHQGHGITTAAFETADEARRWLESVD